MSDCPACTDAQTRMTFLYIEDCITCTVRRISNAPLSQRQAHYATIADKEERDAFVLAVALEHRRRKGFQP